MNILRAIFFIALFTPASSFGAVYLIDVQGSINPGSADYILESLKDARTAKAEALVLRLNTPGGLLVSTRSIVQGISDSPVPVIVWIGPGGASATSAGALITMAAHVAVMSPGTNIGAAHPVGGQGEDVKGTMGEKVTNDTAAFARALANLRGRSAEKAELIVTKSQSFSDQEALKEKIIDFIASDLPGIFAAAAGKKVKVGNVDMNLKFPAGEVIRQEMSLKQRFLHLISDPNVSAMLLTLAGIAFWAEISSGFSSIAAGAIGLFALVLGLVSLQTLPINVGGAALLGLGFVLLVLEAFVTSYGLLAVASVICLFLGGLFLIDPAYGSMRVSLSLLVALVAGVSAVVGTIGWMLSREKGGRSKADPVLGAEAKVSTVEASGHGGTAHVNGELWSFEYSGVAAPGEILRVKKIEGLKIFLERKI